MFDHVTIRVEDVDASARFYDTVLAQLGVSRTATGDGTVAWHDFSIVAADARQPVTQNLHVGFWAPSTTLADAFWRAGIDADHPDDGAPGPRPVYGDDYYGAFLLDPDGNSAEAVHHSEPPECGHVDHLWIRVADVAASKRFYATVAPQAGLSLGTDRPERVQFRGRGASFSLVAGDHRTKHLHLAFGVEDDARVDAFHAAATAAGHRDNGAPGERPQHHGRYAAFVLDPDGHNVELVHRNR